MAGSSRGSASIHISKIYCNGYLARTRASDCSLWVTSHVELLLPHQVHPFYLYTYTGSYSHDFQMLGQLDPVLLP